MARILIVDDSTVMRKNLSSIFTGNGHEVVGEAADGRQAVLLYSTLKPDLVTMDITMPKMTGIEALIKIRETSPNAKIVMITAMGNETMVKEAILSGATNFIVKPFQENKIVEVLSKI
jgi:two-component system chemotaxis response regulator CheY